MSEYAGSKKFTPRSLDDLPPEELTGTLFDPALDETLDIAYDKELDDTVDKQNVPYATARKSVGPRPGEAELDKDMAPYWTMEEYYEKWLAMMKIMGGVAKRESFGVVAHYDEDVQERYGASTGRVMRGARHNMDNGIRAYRRVFGEDDLIAAGFDELEIRDESNMMYNQMRRAYFGPENAGKRKAARKHAKQRLEAIRSSSHDTAI